MEGNACSIAKTTSARATTWRIIRALALGALLGGALMLSSRQLDASTLLFAVLQSAFSAMVIGALVPVRSQALSLDTWCLPS